MIVLCSFNFFSLNWEIVAVYVWMIFFTWLKNRGSLMSSLISSTLKIFLNTFPHLETISISHHSNPALRILFEHFSSFNYFPPKCNRVDFSPFCISSLLSPINLIDRIIIFLWTIIFLLFCHSSMKLYVLRNRKASTFAKTRLNGTDFYR